MHRMAWKYNFRIPTWQVTNKSEKLLKKSSASMEKVKPISQKKNLLTMSPPAPSISMADTSKMEKNSPK